MATCLNCRAFSAVASVVLAFGACTGAGPYMSASDESTVVRDSSGISKTLAASVGQEVDIKLGTVGPGAFDSLPTISSSGVRFLDAAFVSPYVPAGPRQLFRFVAVAQGRVVLTFRHAVVGRFVSDTLEIH